MHFNVTGDERLKDFMRKWIDEKPDSLEAVLFEQLLAKTGFQFAQIYPGHSKPYELENKNPSVVVIDDGSVTHDMLGTNIGPAAFRQDDLIALFKRASGVLVNAGHSDRQAGELILAAVHTIGAPAIIIETEGKIAWADWVRLVYKSGSNAKIVIRKPPEWPVPADLGETLRFSPSTSTVQ